ncbi:hypothetical protein [Leptolyngbya sp. BC1307]|uniref:hypothetical protein n=1 Tax=Leptolyngbya sp. BC1307 TaxID=2029589 RepID=UPI000EFA751A|nr:hypothetical protein [Leptolyngbya sp. BC1307]
MIQLLRGFVPRRATSSQVGWMMGVVAIALTTLTSCQSVSSLSRETTLTPAPTNSASQQPASSPKQSSQSRKITFRQPDGRPQFSLQFKSTGGKLTDPAGKVIANLILESDGAVRLTDASNQTVGYVVQTGDTWEIQGPKQTKPLFTFRQEANGNATLLRNDGSPVYQLTATDSGYTVTADKTAQYTVDTHKGNGQIQTDEGQTVIATDSAIAPAALASFGFAKLTPAQQAGLAYALTEVAVKPTSFKGGI